MRQQIGAWNHVVLTFANEPERTRDGLSDFKIVRFIDDHGNSLELVGTNYGYPGGAPRELRQVLIGEGFADSARLESAILNSGRDNVYPQTIPRD